MSKNIIKGNKSVLIWGATPSIKSLLEEIEYDYHILGFIDNNSDKWGTYLFGKPVYSPSEICNVTFDFIIILSLSSMVTIKKQIINLGISEKYIITKYVENRIAARINFLKNLSEILYEKNILGSIAEIGVFQGDFAKYLCEYFPDRTLYLFDTFSGFDERDIKIERDNNFSDAITGHLKNTSVDVVMNKMKYPQNIVIKKGFFPETADGIDDDFCFINMDLDLYKPTLEGLKIFWDKLNIGGIILIHDYFSDGYIGVRKAVEEFIPIYQSNLVTFPIGDASSIAILKLS